METINFVVIVINCVCMALSLPLIKIIYDHIHLKPILSQTVIDLCYSDCMIYLYFFNLTFAIGVSSCLASAKITLDFPPALIISVAAYFFLCNSLWYLTISGALRLITIVKNSEQAGIQLFGPDNIAIWKIRWISVVLTSSLLLTGLLYFQSFPSFYYTLSYEKTIDGTDMYKQDPYLKVYLIPMFLVVIANGLPKLYGMVLDKLYFLEHNKKFAVSLESTLIFPFLIGLLILFQFTTRINRLLYYDPLLLIFSCDIIPLLIISKNNMMKKQLREKMSNLFNCRLPCLSTKRTTSVFPTDLINGV
jgi:hypothetical protein